MSKKRANIVFSKLTDQQLGELMQTYGMNMSETIALAIDRLYQAETKDGKLPTIEQLPSNRRGNFPDRMAQQNS